jgi:hypothetical protein
MHDPFSRADVSAQPPVISAPIDGALAACDNEPLRVHLVELNGDVNVALRLFQAA